MKRHVFQQQRVFGVKAQRLESTFLHHVNGIEVHLQFCDAFIINSATLTELTWMLLAGFSRWPRLSLAILFGAERAQRKMWVSRRIFTSLLRRTSH